MAHRSTQSERLTRVRPLSASGKEHFQDTVRQHSRILLHYSRSVEDILEQCHSATIYDAELLKTHLLECHESTLSAKRLERRFGDWLMVFRVQSGTNQSVVNTYMTSGLADEKDESMPEQCISLDGRRPCDVHYRHSLLDRWESSNIQQVKVELYNNGLYVAHVIFDADQSSSTSWFSRDRVVSSSWIDLKTTKGNFFNFFGDRNTLSNHNRRLFINYEYDGCIKDRGWMVVIDGIGACKWDQPTSFPTIKYSPNSVHSLIEENFVTADVLAIYVMLG